MNIERLLQNLRVLLHAHGITNEIRIRHVLAREIQDMALAVVVQDAKDIQGTVSAVVHHPFDTALTAALGHLTGILVKQLRPHDKPHSGS